MHAQLIAFFTAAWVHAPYFPKNYVNIYSFTNHFYCKTLYASWQIVGHSSDTVTFSVANKLTSRHMRTTVYAAYSFTGSSRGLSKLRQTAPSANCRCKNVSGHTHTKPTFWEAMKWCRLVKRTLASTEKCE